MKMKVLLLMLMMQQRKMMRDVLSMNGVIVTVHLYYGMVEIVT